MGLINSAANGATEIPGTSNDSLFVFMACPIRYWWTPGVEGKPIHTMFMEARDRIHFELSADFLVYAPWRAWRGPWNEIAQEVNDHAITLSDAFVWLSVDGVRAQGTADELELAKSERIPHFEINCNKNIRNQLADVKRQLFEYYEKLREV